MHTPTLRLNQRPPQIAQQPVSNSQVMKNEALSIAQELELMKQEQEPIPEVKPEDYLQKLTATERKPSPDTVIDAETGAKSIPDPMPVALEKPVLDPAKAKSKTERLLKFRDFLQKKGLAFLAGDMALQSTFGMEPWEFEMLEEIYTDTLIEMGHIPKWLDFLIVEAMVLGPKISKALGNRKVLAENKRLQAKIEQLEARPDSHYRAPEPQGQFFRTDLKKWWQIDANGYFLYDLGGYIKAENKKDKPDVSDAEQYALAVKYNGRDKIHQIFNISV